VDVVLDSNVLFRLLISPGDIIDLLFHQKLTIYAPKRLQEEFLSNRQEILSKSRIPQQEFNKLSAVLFSRIIFVPLEEYTQFLPQAKKILQSHEKDEDFVALALLKQCKIWSYETRLLDLGFGILTKQISKELLL
jgi:predicted nucleic acid-binding protein